MTSNSENRTATIATADTHNALDPSFSKAIVWGFALLGFAAWVSPTRLSFATRNLGESMPPWVEWPSFVCLLIVPALERLAQRRKGLVQLQIGSAVAIAAAALLLRVGKLSDTWLPLTFGMVLGTLVTMIGWAIFVASIPEPRQASRLFAARLGMSASGVLWVGVIQPSAGALHERWDWDLVWVVVMTTWAVLTALWAMCARLSLPNEPPPAPITNSSLSDIYAAALQHFWAKPGLLWILAFALSRALVEYCKSAHATKAVMTIFEADRTASGNSLLGALSASCAIASLLVFVFVAKYGIDRCWRPLVILVGATTLGLAAQTFAGEPSLGWAIAIFSFDHISAEALATAWYFYAFRQVLLQPFLLSHLAWLLALPTLAKVVAHLLLVELLPLDHSAVTALSLGMFAILFVYIGFRTPLERPARSG